MMHTTQIRVVAESRTFAIGLLLALVMAAMLLAAGSAHATTTFTVNSTADKGDQTPGDGKCFTGDILKDSGEDVCTLRAAIQEANATTGADTINFDILGTGVATIVPATELPAITKPLTINGYSQPGAKPNAKPVGSDAILKIELDGPGGGAGLVITGSNSTVKGLVINRSGAGIHIDGPTATGNKVAGNYIGTDATGTKDLGNTYHGVYINYGKDNTIGGTTAGERNVISGNNGNGVLIEGAGASGNKVTGNFIGTDKNGAAPLGNSANGVYISGPNNTVGSTTAGGRNTISGNEGSGVSIYGATAAGNRILQNSIFANGGLGIDLGDDGPTANDPSDADTGPNGLQNKPVVTSAKTGALKTTINTRLNSNPNRAFTVQFFSNPGGGDEGKKFIGQKSVTTDGSGNATFSFSPAQKVGVGRTVTATATSPGGSTSEFSAARTVASS